MITYIARSGVPVTAPDAPRPCQARIPFFVLSYRLWITKIVKDALSR